MDPDEAASLSKKPRTDSGDLVDNLDDSASLSKKPRTDSGDRKSRFWNVGSDDDDDDDDDDEEYEDDHVYGGITELQIGDHNKEELKTMAEIAIANFNAQSKEEGVTSAAFGSVEIINAKIQVVAGLLYYITFVATDATQGTRTFDAEVFYNLKGCLELEDCKMKT